jgi:hypothetical protein
MIVEVTLEEYDITKALLHARQGLQNDGMFRIVEDIAEATSRIVPVPRHADSRIKAPKAEMSSLSTFHPTLVYDQSRIKHHNSSYLSATMFTGIVETIGSTCRSIMPSSPPPR